MGFERRIRRTRVVRLRRGERVLVIAERRRRRRRRELLEEEII